MNGVDVVKGNVVELLQQLGNGKVMYDLDHSIQEVVQAVRDYPQQSGSITLKIVVSPFTKGDEGRVLVDASVSSKTPRKPGEKKVYFTTRNNTLVRDDPNQEVFKGEGFEAKQG